MTFDLAETLILFIMLEGVFIFKDNFFIALSGFLFTIWFTFTQVIPYGGSHATYLAFSFEVLAIGIFIMCIIRANEGLKSYRHR